MEEKYAILIVDDNVDLASSLRDILETEGYNVTLSHNGQDTLAICRQKNFNLALVDIKLPDISGTELIEELAGLSLDMQYIIITGHASLDSATAAAKRESVVSYEIKPLDIDHLLAITRQVFERKQAEEALKASEAKYQDLYENAPDMYVSVDLTTTKILGCNQTTATALGYTKEDIVGRPIFDMYHSDCMDNVKRAFQSFVKTGEVRNAELQLKRKDGTKIDVSLNVSAVYDDQGNILHSRSAWRDITERKKMEEQLLTNDRLVSIGELVSGVAHELNNPLTSVIGFSDLLAGRKDLPDDVKEDLKLINKEAKRTSKIVKNLLTFARKQPKEKQLTVVNQAIEVVLELRAYEQKISNLQVNTQFALDLPEIMANSFDLQQVFLNIIVNAEHAMLEAHGKGTITITTERDGDIIRVSLADDGPGISPENLGHIFDPFFTTKEVGKGTGLGLSICHGIITEHGGRIYAESELGKRTTFIIELPVTTTDNEGTVNENS